MRQNHQEEQGGPESGPGNAPWTVRSAMERSLAEPLRVLLVEDEAIDAELSLRELKRAGLSCVGVRVDTEPAFRSKLVEFQPHVILSDFSMPQFDGMSALAIAHQSYPDIPFIFVSGTLGEEYAIRAMKSGASDYVLKDNLVRLPPTVERALLEARSAAEQRRTQAALRHSEQRFRLAASTGDVWDWVIATGETHMSYQWKQRLGYQDHEIADTAAAWMAQVHPEDREPLRKGFIAHLKHRLPFGMEYRERTRSGEYLWSYVKGLALWDENGRATYMAGTIIDITERRLAEIRIQRLNRVYAMLSGINALIVRVQNREDLFREACRVAVEHGQFRAAWVGLVDQAAARIQPMAWCGTDDDYIARVPMSLVERDPSGNGRLLSLAAEAVLEGRAVVVDDLQSDPRVRLKDDARERGLRSLAVLPLPVGGRFAGVLALYASEPGFFDAAEIKLLLELASDIAFALDHIEKAERLNYLAYFDALTGLANRSLLHERLTQHIESARRERHKLAVLVINVDRFKAINDTLGRQAGDQLLQQLAQRYQQDTRDGAWYARIEADHFALVLPDLKSEEELARRIEANYQAQFGPPFQAGEAELRISARFGIAMFPNDGGDAEALLRNAEAAGKKARTSGERYLFYAQEMTDKIAGSLALENKLRQALERDEFVLYYQPKVDAASRRILGVEALIRWRSPEMGLVPPMQFIPLMEETGLIRDVGAWALRQAALDHLHLQTVLGPLGMAVPRIAVNVSPVQLRRSDFVDTVRAAIELGAQPTGIDLEITESLIMEDTEVNIEKLKRLRGFGLSVAIDDFGTGYSSLRYLAKLPVQTLKIDRSFVITMLEEADTMTLVSTVISLAHSLRLKVVAEGVDSEAQAAVLRELGCDEMQGFLFSRPLPLPDIQALLLAAPAPAPEGAV